MNYFQNLRWRIKNFFSSPKRTYIFLGAVAVLAAGSALAYQVWPRDEVTGEKKALIERSQYPIFSVIQNNKSRVLYYDFDAKRTYELFSMDANPEQGFYLTTDYSGVKNQVAYANSEGIFVYDLKEAKSTKLLGHLKKNDGEGPGNEIYYAPQWSPDGSKIAYRIGYYEGGGYGYMNADGSGAQTLGGGYDFAWKKDSAGYALGSSVGLDAGGLSVSTDLAAKAKEIIDGDEDAQSISWLDDETILLTVGASLADPAVKEHLITIKASGEGRTTLEKDTDQNSYAVADTDGSIYFAKFNRSSSDSTNPGSGKGIYVTNLTDKKSTNYYADGNKPLFPVSVSSKHLAVRSSNHLGSEAALTRLMLIAKADKAVIEFAEANKIAFSGWLNSAKVPNGVKQVDTVTPTDEEKQAYEDALKTKGFLSYTYYNYCWDYDCNAGTFPASKKDKPFVPDLYSLTKPYSSLTGTVEIPVVLAYDVTKFADGYVALFKDASVKNTPAYYAKWLNEQAAAAGQKLTFKLSFQDQHVQTDQSCIRTFANSNIFMELTCLRGTVIKAIPALASSKLMYVIIANDNSGDKSVYNLGQDTVSDGSGIVGTRQYAYKTDLAYYDPIASLKQNFESQSPYSFEYSRILEFFGAKSKRTTYGTAKSGTLVACAAEPSEDIMCRWKYKDATQKDYTFIPLHELKIGDITRKELGWFDADGDKVNEVDDKCPYNKANNCKK